MEKMKTPIETENALKKIASDYPEEIDMMLVVKHDQETQDSEETQSENYNFGSDSVSATAETQLMAPSSSSRVTVSRGSYMTLSELEYGVVETFQPTDLELVRDYLYNKIRSGREDAFPELEIYGKNGMEPWEIWRRYEAAMKFPHQDYIYFYSRLKKCGWRFVRKVGSDGTWSNESVKPIFLESMAIGKARKFMYEHKNKNFEQHAKWSMEEYTLANSSSNLALCRIKKTDGNKQRKRKMIASADQEDEDFGPRKTKSLKLLYCMNLMEQM